MRKSFDGLSGLVGNHLKRDPLSGDVYLFLNKRRDRIKLLFWERDGFWIFYKRLEEGTFQQPLKKSSDGSVELYYEELVMLLKGIDLHSIKRRKRYSHSHLEKV
jgi:transposase